MKETHYKILSHSLGMTYEKRLPKEFYRNHFAANQGHSSYETLLELVSEGLMEKATGITIVYFYVTVAGENAFRDEFKAIKAAKKAQKEGKSYESKTAKQNEN